MTNYSVSSVDEFIAASPQEAQAHQKEIRKIVRSTLSNVEEKIGYGKPYYKYHRWLVGFDVYKQHIGFEIWEGQLPQDIRSELEEKGYKTGNKTFQIRFEQKVPTAIIKKLVKHQEKLAEEKVASKR